MYFGGYMNIWLNNLSLSVKIIGNSSFLIIMLLVISLYSISVMSSIGHELEGISEHDIPVTENLTLITSHQLEQAIHFERALRFAGETHHNNGDQSLFEAEIVAFDKLSHKVEQEIEEGESLAKQILSETTDLAEIKEFTYVYDALNKIEIEHKDFETHAHQVFDLLRQGQGQGKEYTALLEKVEHEEQQLDKELEELLI